MRQRVPDERVMIVYASGPWHYPASVLQECDRDPAAQPAYVVGLDRLPGDTGGSWGIFEERQLRSIIGEVCVPGPLVETADPCEHRPARLLCKYPPCWM